MELIYISGGQRSGKSRFAQNKALEDSRNPVYLATARQWDEDFAKRIARHRSDRGENWKTEEIEKNISAFPMEKYSNQEQIVVVLDCVTLWLTNFFTDNQGDPEKTLNQAQEEWDAFMSLDLRVFAISNEIGMGLHSENDYGRNFTDVQGFMNQYISGKAKTAYFMVSGRAIRIE